MNNMGLPRLTSYRGIDAGDIAVTRHGERIIVAGMDVITSEGASFGIAIVYAVDGRKFQPPEIERYEKPDGK